MTKCAGLPRCPPRVASELADQEAYVLRGVRVGLDIGAYQAGLTGRR